MPSRRGEQVRTKAVVRLLPRRGGSHVSSSSELLLEATATSCTGYASEMEYIGVYHTLLMVSHTPVIKTTILKNFANKH